MDGITANTLALLATQLSEGSESSTGDWYRFARMAMTFADQNCHGFATTLTADETLVGKRVRVQPYVTVPRTPSSSSPMRLPVTVPGVITEVHAERKDGPIEYAYVEIDGGLLGMYPFTRTQSFIVSRGELHAETCKCAPCQSAPDRFTV